MHTPHDYVARTAVALAAILPLAVALGAGESMASQPGDSLFGLCDSFLSGEADLADPPFVSLLDTCGDALGEACDEGDLTRFCRFVPPPQCPAPGEIETRGIPSANQLGEWQAAMVDFGLRLVASPQLAAWIDYLVASFEGMGLQVDREPVEVPGGWWDHTSWSLQLIEGSSETEVPVSAYRPYSGITPAEGIVAELADAGLGFPADFAMGDFVGKIALIQQPALPLTRGFLRTPATIVYDPDGEIPSNDPYNRAWTAILAPQAQSPARAQASGAVGAIVAWDYSAEAATGMYVPFQSTPASEVIPTLYVDRETGAMLRAKIASGASVRLTLRADVFSEGISEDIVATLPGQTDEVILVNAHSDGVNASQENAGVGMLALADYFASLPLSCRRRTLVFALPVGHFFSGLGGDTERFIERNPDIIARTAGSLTMEHLGQMEWEDDPVLGFHATGKREMGVLFTSTKLVDVAQNALLAEDWRRNQINPIDGSHFGVGDSLKLAGVPNIAYIAGPHVLFSWGEKLPSGEFTQHLERTSSEELRLSVRAFARMMSALGGDPFLGQ